MSSASANVYASLGGKLPAELSMEFTIMDSQVLERYGGGGGDAVISLIYDH